MKDIETKQLFGWRESDSDGFTYRYGRYRNGYVKRTRHNNEIRRMVRHDKRAVKAKALRRIMKEVFHEGEEAA